MPTLGNPGKSAAGNDRFKNLRKRVAGKEL
jgi:hypothetical protein